jgi:hypothetical protein
MSDRQLGQPYIVILSIKKKASFSDQYKDYFGVRNKSSLIIKCETRKTQLSIRISDLSQI